MVEGLFSFLFDSEGGLINMLDRKECFVGEFLIT